MCKACADASKAPRIDHLGTLVECIRVLGVATLGEINRALDNPATKNACQRIERDLNKLVEAGVVTFRFKGERSTYELVEKGVRV